MWVATSGWALPSARAISGAGLILAVSALALDGNDLYAGGDFFGSGEVMNIGYVARWDGSNWSGLGDGLDNSVRALAVGNGDLYAGGVFTQAGGAGANQVA